MYTKRRQVVHDPWLGHRNGDVLLCLRTEAAQTAVSVLVGCCFGYLCWRTPWAGSGCSLVYGILYTNYNGLCAVTNIFRSPAVRVGWEANKTYVWCGLLGSEHQIVTKRRHNIQNGVGCAACRLPYTHKSYHFIKVRNNHNWFSCFFPFSGPKFWGGHGIGNDMLGLFSSLNLENRGTNNYKMDGYVKTVDT